MRLAGTEGAEKVVEKLKCKVCAQFAERIRGRRNFSEKWIVGANSVCTSNLRDHARNDQHAHTMSLLNKLGSSILCSNCEGAQHAFRGRERQKVKFDIAYLVTTEKLPYTKYQKIYELEARHRVKIGTSYQYGNAGMDFMHYIAEAKQHDLLQKVTMPSSSLSCSMVLLIKATLTMKSCWLYGVIRMELTIRSIPGWTISQ